MPPQVFVTGGTGYIGQPLIAELMARGHAVTALSREASKVRLPAGCEVATGDALRAASFAAAIRPGATLVHLVGTPHPNPRKAAQFRSVDLASIQASVAAAREAGAAHLVYVSVAQPAPAMRAYVQARSEGEALVRASGIPATFVRPWYVLGPGHRWPLLLVPLYALLQRIPATRQGALRLGLVRLDDMVAALIEAVERPPQGVRVMDVPVIRGARRHLAAPPALPRPAAAHPAT